MSMDVKGKVTHILPIQSGVSKAGKDWSKQEFVIVTEEQIARNICFTLFGDKLSLLNGIKPGMQVEVFFNVESREFSGKWYHNINAWKINPVQMDSDGHPGFSSDDIPPPPFDNEQEPPVDDLPF
jgi:hypothetical protein